MLQSTWRLRDRNNTTNHQSIICRSSIELVFYVVLCEFGLSQSNDNPLCGLRAICEPRKWIPFLPIPMHPGVLCLKNCMKHNGINNETKQKKCFVECWNRTCYVLWMKCQNNEMKNGHTAEECNAIGSFVVAIAFLGNFALYFLENILFRSTFRFNLLYLNSTDNVVHRACRPSQR